MKALRAFLAAALFAAISCFAQVGGPVIGQGGASGTAAITSGTIDGATIGGTTPGAITGTTVTATTAFRAADGSAATPGQSFTGATGTGWSRVSGNLTASVGGTSVAAFLSSGLFPSLNGTFDLGGAGAGWKRLYVDYTNTGTVGAVTINKSAGRVNIAAAGTSVVVTNSNVTAAAHVFANASVNDATCWVKSVVPASGSFTLTTNAACTAQTSFDFFVINAD